MKKFWLTALVVLVLAGGSAYYWFIVESHVPENAAYDLDIEQLRRLAAEQQGDQPLKVEVERVAGFRFPATAVIAGDGWHGRDLPVFSYRIVFPNSSIIVDTALNREIGGERLAEFDPDAYGRMQAAMTTATRILITHEHMDHIGGITAYQDIKNLRKALLLTKEQLAEPERSLPAKFPEHALDGYKPLEYDQALAIAPGVVLLKAPGHTPGSQIVYVRTAEGTELLLIGDIAWQFGNIERLRERARLMTQFLIKEDRTAVFGQLVALKRLHEAQPAVHIVPGHDANVVEALIRAGALSSQFGSQESDIR